MTPRRLLRFWILSSLFCAINGFLIYLLAPTPRGSNAMYADPLIGLAGGLACALGATLALALYGWIAARRRRGVS